MEIAYIGITTSSTISSSNPAQFKNEDGEIIYTFNEADMYSLVQANIDAAEKAGADYVIALSHVGYDESDELFDITDTIQQQAAVRIDREIGGTDAQMPEFTQSVEPPKAR